MNRSASVIATIEARMTSTRLPGKVLLPAVSGKSMLEIMIERVKRVKQLKRIVVATTINQTDNPVVRLAKKMKVDFYRGSEKDVLSRIFKAACQFKTETIVELTGDCPLIDPDIISQAINCYLDNDCDYLSTGNPLYYPQGMDTQVFSLKALTIAYNQGLTPEDREHVSLYIVRNPSMFKQITLNPPKKLRRPDIFLNLDEKQDYILIKQVLKMLYNKNKNFNCYDIVDLFDSKPHLLEINRRNIS